MIVPSIDIVAGSAVQLVGGEVQAFDGGDPVAWMEHFRLAGEVAVVDIDAARGEGDNREAVERLCEMGRVRVGGGIRDADTALRSFIRHGEPDAGLFDAQIGDLVCRLSTESGRRLRIYGEMVEEISRPETGPRL